MLKQVKNRNINSNTNKTVCICIEVQWKWCYNLGRCAMHVKLLHVMYKFTESNLQAAS